MGDKNSRFSLTCELGTIRGRLGEPDKHHAVLSSHREVFASSWKSQDDARKKLAKLCADMVRIADEIDENWQRCLLMTGDGHAFLVQWRHGAWGYEIYGPGRKRHSSTWGQDSFDDALKAAREHADGAFGGVTWECR